MTDEEWDIIELYDQINKDYLKVLLNQSSAIKIYKNKNHTRYLVISNSFKKDYHYRLTVFDKQGPVCHFDRKTLEEIVEETYEEMIVEKDYFLDIEKINIR